MAKRPEQPYDLDELRPLLWIFASGLTVMGVVSVVALGVWRGPFAWFLVAGGVFLFLGSFVLERVLTLIAGPPLSPDEQRGRTSMPRPQPGIRPSQEERV